MPGLVRRPSLWYGALLVLIVAGGLFLWAISARVRWVDLGPESAMRTDWPTRVVVTRAGAAPLPIWVVTTGGGWLVFDARSPVRPDCEIGWVPSSDTFWDLCHAWTLIWSRHGMLLSYPELENEEITPYLHDLDRFRARIDNEHVWADVSHRLPGAARTAPPDEAECRPFFDTVIYWTRCMPVD